MTTAETAESPNLTSFVTKMIGHQRTMAAGLVDVTKGMETIAAGYEALQLDIAQIRAETLRWAADRIDPGPRESDDPAVTVADADRGTASNLRLWAGQIEQCRLLPAGGDVTYQWGVRWFDGRIASYGDLEDMAREAARRFPKAELVRRAERRWADGSRYIGPLEVVDADALDTAGTAPAAGGEKQ